MRVMICCHLVTVFENVPLYLTTPIGPVPDGPANCGRGAGWRAARHAVRGAAAFVVVSLATVALDRDEGFRPSRERILVEGCALSGGCTVSERRALTASGASRFF